jgi:ABC-type Na+ transport system ATPase subunit NatA
VKFVTNVALADATDTQFYSTLSPAEQAQYAALPLSEKPLYHARQLVRVAAERAIVKEVAVTSADDFVRSKLGNDAIRVRAQQSLDAMQAGITIGEVLLGAAVPPLKVRDDFRAVSEAESDRAQSIENAQKEARQILTAAAGSAHGALVFAIDQYEAARRLGEASRIARAENAINSLMAGQPAATALGAFKDDPQVDQDRLAPLLTADVVTGQVPAMINEAVSYKTKVFKDFWMRTAGAGGRPGDVPHRAARDLRAAGAQRVGQEHDDQDDAGPAQADGGRIAVFGKDPTDVAIKRRIGYLPEESYLYGFLNARETLDYYGKLFELDRKTRKRRIDELLDMVGLTHAQFRPVREYSKGMQRRIGIAQALINDPEFLILDEPTTGLDPIGTRQVKDLIIETRAARQDRPALEPPARDVEDVVDRMVILYGGKRMNRCWASSAASNRPRRPPPPSKPRPKNPSRASRWTAV